MNRRRALGLGGAGLGAALIGVPVLFVATGPGSGEATLDAARKILDQLEARSSLTTVTAWSPGQVFAHLAQSIEYSMVGFPQLKSAAFQKSVGSLAFALFGARGEMVHGTTTPIPGSPTLPETSIPEGLIRLRAAMDAFDAYSGALQPHFAYGALSKAEFEVAHALHLRDHLPDFG